MKRAGSPHASNPVLGTQRQVDTRGSVESDPSPQREFQAGHLKDNTCGYPLASLCKFKHTHPHTHTNGHTHRKAKTERRKESVQVTAKQSRMESAHGLGGAEPHYLCP